MDVVLLVLVLALLLVLDDGGGTLWLHAQARKRRDRKR